MSGPMIPCLDCGELTTRSRCPEHTAAARPYDAAWRRVRLQVLERDGRRCRIQDQRICLVEADTVDHIVKLINGGARLDPANLRAACRPCNSSQPESERSTPFGRARTKNEKRRSYLRQWERSLRDAGLGYQQGEAARSPGTSAVRHTYKGRRLPPRQFEHCPRCSAVVWPAAPTAPYCGALCQRKAVRS